MASATASRTRDEQQIASPSEENRLSWVQRSLARLVDSGPLGKGVQHHLGTTLLFLVVVQPCGCAAHRCPSLSSDERAEEAVE